MALLSIFRPGPDRAELDRQLQARFAEIYAVYKAETEALQPIPPGWGNVVFVHNEHWRENLMSIQRIGDTARTLNAFLAPIRLAIFVALSTMVPYLLLQTLLIPTHNGL